MKIREPTCSPPSQGGGVIPWLILKPKIFRNQKIAKLKKTFQNLQGRPRETAAERQLSTKLAKGPPVILRFQGISPGIPRINKKIPEN